MAELRRTSVTATQALPPDSRTAMGRAAGSRPFKPYIASERPGRQEPPEVTAVRERWRLREETMPDPDPDPDGDELAELIEARDRYHAAMTVVCPSRAVPPPAPPMDPAPPAIARCRRCGYLTSAVGHKVACQP